MVFCFSRNNQTKTLIKMEKNIKLKIRTGVLSGLIFAVIMAGFEFYDEEKFSVLKFIFHAVIFGFFMGLMARDRSKKNTD